MKKIIQIKLMVKTNYKLLGAKIRTSRPKCCWAHFYQTITKGGPTP
jgi:hypothetical protein